MMNPTLLITDTEHMTFQRIKDAYVRAGYLVPVLVLYTLVLTALFSGVVGLEYELIYRVFEYLADGQDYWSPALMAFAGLIMVTAYHYSAKARPGNFAVKLVDGLVSVLIVLFIMGLGLLIMNMVSADGLDSLFGEDAAIGVLMDENADEDVLDVLFSILGPLAGSSFALGVGGLSIINLFVAHSLFVRIQANAEEIYARIKNRKEAVRIYTLIEKGIEAHAIAEADHADLLALDASYHARKLAHRAHKEITLAAADARDRVKALEAAPEPSRFLPATATPDPKAMTKEVTRLEAITLDDILKIIHPNP